MINIGKVNQLLINRETESGFYLKDLDSDEEVFMPPSLAPMDMKIDEIIEAFVYHDGTDSKLATGQIPVAEVGEYALLSVVETQDFGAFFEWGIEKDLLVPGNEQKVKVRMDEDHIVRICLEEKTGRVFGTTKLGKYIQESVFDIAEGDQVMITIGRKTDLGFRVIVNKKFIGMIYDNEIYTELYPGEDTLAYVKKLRDDGLIDLSLQSLGVKNLVDAKDIILETLNLEKGVLNLGDKSLPEAIKAKLGMSKKTFKSAIGMLYKDKKIIIHKDKIELVKEEN